MKPLLCLTALAALAASVQIAQAQDFPERLVTLVVPQAPGGTTDVLGRNLAAALAERWGQSVVVENIDGAAGAIGTQQMVSAAPDGYRLLFTYEGSQAINPHVVDSGGFDPVEDFTPLGSVARASFTLVVPPNSPIASFEDYRSVAREQPGTLTYGSAGAGSANHLIGELIRTEADAPTMHIPYRGVSQALNEVLGGQIDSVVASVPSVLGQVQSGALRALAVTSGTRTESLPDVPTLAEAGVESFDIAPWWGVLGPVGMDPDLADRIARDLEAVLQEDGLRETFIRLGAEPFYLPPEDFRALLADDVAKWGTIVSSIDIEG